jgi:hydroxymethylpyrimidine/phosphomethylpyrimidine kinase
MAVYSSRMMARVLSVAGSDSGGGAGIQADVKTITALGAYAATAITALTAQSTLGVFEIMAVPAGFVRRQMRVVLDDIGADAVKTGMLVGVDIIEAVAEELAATHPQPLLVVDPVMVAKGGAPLLAAEATRALIERLFPLATVVTPNAPEAAALTGLPVASPEDLERAGHALLELGARAVYMKGGHVAGDEVVDVLVTREAAPLRLAGPRIVSRSTHGTGCTLASAIATGLAQKLHLAPACARARHYVEAAIASAPDLGRGHGPLAHGHAIPPYQS